MTEKDIASYKETAAEYGNIFPVAVHASYLINIASPDSEIWEKSYQALKVEVERAGVLGIPLITFHPGSYMSTDAQTGLMTIVGGLRRLLKETADSAPETTVCLERIGELLKAPLCARAVVEDSGGNKFGWMMVIWPRSNTVSGATVGYDTDQYQTWMGVKYSALDQWSAAMDGAVMANFNCFSDQVLPNLGINYDYVDMYHDGHVDSPCRVGDCVAK